MDYADMSHVEKWEENWTSLQDSESQITVGDSETLT